VRDIGLSYAKEIVSIYLLSFEYNVRTIVGDAA